MFTTSFNTLMVAKTSPSDANEFLIFKGSRSNQEPSKTHTLGVYFVLDVERRKGKRVLLEQVLSF